MQFLLSPELREFAAGMRRLLASELPSGALRSYLTAPSDEELSRQTLLWSKLYQLGALAAALPESSGGFGFGLPAAAVILEEAGRALLPLPIHETLALAALPLMLLAADPHQQELLERIASGELRLTGRLPGEDPLAAALTAEPHGGSEGCTHLLTGSVPLVPSLDRASGIVLAAADGGEGSPCLYFISLQGQPREALQQEAVPTFDLLRRYFRVSLKGARALRLSSRPAGPEAATQAWERARRAMELLSAAELCGIAAAVVSLTVEYVKTRKQFGRSIGSFQAVQHHLADMQLDCEQLTALTRFAAWAHAGDPSQFEQAATAAKALTSEAVPKLIERAIQVHGGIGFTFEYDLHLYLRRALVLSAGFDPAATGFERLGAHALRTGGA